MELSIGFSPCPNDTFIFDAWVHKKIPIPTGLSFNWHIADVESLNQMSFRNSLHVSKISFHTYAKVQENYQLLTSGSALGNNCGPLLISKKPMKREQLRTAKIVVPGINTTAYFLLRLAFPDIEHIHTLHFSEIENAVLSEKYDAGLIIHENRFTYQDKGLHKIIDLGEYWEETTHCPIPLGGIMILRNLPLTIKLQVQQLMLQSVLYAYNHPEESGEFIKLHSQEMEDKIIQQHIALYVNDFTQVLGNKGQDAILTFLEFHHKFSFSNKITYPIYV